MPRCCFQCPRWQLSQWKNEGGRLLSREPSTTQWMRASCLDLCDDSDDSCLPRSLQGSTSWKELHAETHSIVRETFSRIEGLKLFNALGSAACLPCPCLALFGHRRTSPAAQPHATYSFTILHCFQLPFTQARCHSSK